MAQITRVFLNLLQIMETASQKKILIGQTSLVIVTIRSNDVISSNLISWEIFSNILSQIKNNLNYALDSSTPHNIFGSICLSIHPNNSLTEHLICIYLLFREKFKFNLNFMPNIWKYFYWFSFEIKASFVDFHFQFELWKLIQAFRRYSRFAQWTQ